MLSEHEAECITGLINRKTLLNVEKSHPSTNSKDFLSIETIRKMINRFLNENEMPKKKLARLLKITKEDLEHLLLVTHRAERLIPKINLPLIKLYCVTKFNGQK